MKNADSQAILLSLVSQLVSGDIKFDANKQGNNNETLNKNQHDVRHNNFINGNGPSNTSNFYSNQQPINEKKIQSGYNDG
jgi:hypothetical protein